jgi:hypothetical protein
LHSLNSLLQLNIIDIQRTLPLNQQTQPKFRGFIEGEIEAESTILEESSGIGTSADHTQKHDSEPGSQSQPNQPPPGQHNPATFGIPTPTSSVVLPQPSPQHPPQRGYNDNLTNFPISQQTFQHPYNWSAPAVMTNSQHVRHLTKLPATNNESDSRNCEVPFVATTAPSISTTITGFRNLTQGDIQIGNHTPLKRKRQERVHNENQGGNSHTSTEPLASNQNTTPSHWHGTTSDGHSSAFAIMPGSVLTPGVLQPPPYQTGRFNNHKWLTVTDLKHRQRSQPDNEYHRKF